MINKFKNVLKVGKKNKELEEGVVAEEIAQDTTETDKEGEIQTEGDVPVEDSVEEVINTEEVPVEGSEESDSSFDESISEDITVEAVESCYKVEASKEKSAQDAGIPLDEHNINDLVCSTLKQFAPMIIKKGIRLELDNLDSVIQTNEEVILFIFQEILSNAINSLKEGCIKIYLEEDKLIFADTGYGIPADEVPKIFNEGFMASNAAPSDEVEGMGMYKCSIALEKMNYGYEIKSTQGKGTTFIIDLSK